jgi:hypothetical protein
VLQLGKELQNGEGADVGLAVTDGSQGHDGVSALGVQAKALIGDGAFLEIACDEQALLGVMGGDRLLLLRRPLVIGRKNWMLTGSKDGGHNEAIIYTLINSCKLNKVDPYAYLVDED